MTSPALQLADFTEKKCVPCKFVGGSMDGWVRNLPGDTLFVDRYYNEVLTDHYLRMDYDPILKQWTFETF